MKLFFLKLAFVTIVILTIASCGISKSTHHKPELTGYNNTIPVVEKQSKTTFFYKNNFLLKNQQNLWELYVEGDPLERGLVIGSLTDSLLNKQERLFFTKTQELLPSKSKQKLIRIFLKWFGRKLYLNIPEEYKNENTKVIIISSNGEKVLDVVNYQGDWPQTGLDIKNVNPVYYYVIKGDAGEKKGSITVIK